MSTFVNVTQAILAVALVIGIRIAVHFMAKESQTVRQDVARRYAELYRNQPAVNSATTEPRPDPTSFQDVAIEGVRS
jgi:hypothetical protein